MFFQVYVELEQTSDARDWSDCGKYLGGGRNPSSPLPWTTQQAQRVAVVWEYFTGEIQLGGMNQQCFLMARTRFLEHVRQNLFSTSALFEAALAGLRSPGPRAGVLNDQQDGTLPLRLPVDPAVWAASTLPFNKSPFRYVVSNEALTKTNSVPPPFSLGIESVAPSTSITELIETVRTKYGGMVRDLLVSPPGFSGIILPPELNSLRPILEKVAHFELGKICGFRKSGSCALTESADLSEAEREFSELNMYLFVNARPVPVGDTQVGAGWHFDGLNVSGFYKNLPVTSLYAWSNKLGTLFYVPEDHEEVKGEGSGLMEHHGSCQQALLARPEDHFNIDGHEDGSMYAQKQEKKERRVYAARAGEIIRFDGATQHAAQANETESRLEDRVFVRVAFSARAHRFDRPGNHLNSALEGQELKEVEGPPATTRTTASPFFRYADWSPGLVSSTTALNGAASSSSAAAPFIGSSPYQPSSPFWTNFATRTTTQLRNVWDVSTAYGSVFDRWTWEMAHAQHGLRIGENSSREARIALQSRGEARGICSTNAVEAVVQEYVASVLEDVQESADVETRRAPAAISRRFADVARRALRLLVASAVVRGFEEEQAAMLGDPPRDPPAMPMQRCGEVVNKEMKRFVELWKAKAAGTGNALPNISGELQLYCFLLSSAVAAAGNGGREEEIFEKFENADEENGGGSLGKRGEREEGVHDYGAKRECTTMVPLHRVHDRTCTTMLRRAQSDDVDAAMRGDREQTDKTIH